MIHSGVTVFKIEGRARGPEYVRTVTECYREAVESCINGTFTEERKNLWDERLATVFNRGFWDGYYLGQRLGEWNSGYGSQATEKKVYVGKCTDYFSKLGVGEFLIEACSVSQDDKLLVTGNKTGALIFTLSDPRIDNQTVSTADKGVRISFKTPEKVRRNDKLYKLVLRK